MPNLCFPDEEKLTKPLFFWYPFEAMLLRDSCVRKCCGKRFTQVFRMILYNPRLTWGAKALAFTILDLPLSAKVINAKLARKLKSSPSQVAVWKKELLKNGFMLIKDTGETQ